jgi:hypothetical protein
VDSARSFAQAFYDWYVRIANQELTYPSDFAVLTERPSVLSATLLRALRADSTAWAHAPGEIVSMDWDPFLNSQDPCDRYEVRKVTLRHGTYWVEVFGSCRGPEQRQPDVVAELSRHDATWTFTNFFDPRTHSDLLSTLRVLARDRARKKH